MTGVVVRGLAAVALGASAACAPLDTESAAPRPPTPTAIPTPTWTPIPIATATPTPVPVSVAAAPAPPTRPTAAVPAATPADSVPTPAATETPADTPTPSGPARFTSDELAARLPPDELIASTPSITVARPGEAEVTAESLGFADQFLDPLVVRRGDPALLALVLVGQAFDDIEIGVVDALFESPTEFLATLAEGLVAGFEASARQAEVLELGVLDAPPIGERSASARTRVASGSDVLEAQIWLSERGGVVGIVIQIARIDDLAALLDADTLLRHIVETDIPRG